MPRKKGVSINWKGPEVRRRVVEATKESIDETMGDCVEEAQPNTPVDTGNLRRSERIIESATEKNGVIAGLWGSADVDYAIHVEIGTATREGVFMLTNAANSQYPTLPGRIKAKLQQ